MPDGSKYSFSDQVIPGVIEYTTFWGQQEFFPANGDAGFKGPDLENADLWLSSSNGPTITKDGSQFILTAGPSCPPAGCAKEQF